MFPKAVQTLIETYAQDMQFLLELKRLKYDGHMKKVIQLGDEATEWLMEFNGHHNVDLELDNRRGLKMVLKAGLMCFMKSPAGFVHRKIAYQEQKRQDLWKSIGVTPTTTLGEFQYDFEGHTSTWEIFWTVYEKEPEVAIGLIRGCGKSFKTLV